MKGPLLTGHAQARVQQRGIPPLILEWLLAYGATKADHRGAEIRYFDRQSRRRLGNAVGHQVVDRLSGLLDTYVVVAENGAVITAGHRTKRINRH